MQYHFIMITNRTLTAKNEIVNEVLYDRQNVDFNGQFVDTTLTLYIER